ncbi:MAG: hypothetical protein JRE23_12210 [Deltaproteobacteria bacterium]|nr:hypothetical protein [Deltaproteobacteria bacterium]
MNDTECFEDCNVPVLCIWKGQTPSINYDRVIIHNFLPLAVIGFRVTENVPAPAPPTTEAECDALIGRHLCPGCDVMEGKCPDICCDPPAVDDGQDRENYTDDQDRENYTDDDDVEACENCKHIKVPLYAEPCDGCFGCSEWKAVGSVEWDLSVDPMAPVHPESLYRAGCWISLENRKHDLMSEWSLAAPDCRFQFEAEERDELLCSHDDHSLFPCHFDECPRLKA